MTTKKLFLDTSAHFQRSFMLHGFMTIDAFRVIVANTATGFELLEDISKQRNNHDTLI